MQEDDVEVVLEDQKRINKFGRLTAKSHVLEGELKEIKEECENLDDALAEVSLLDEESVRYRIGGVFVSVTREDAEERTEKALEGARERRDTLESELNSIRDELRELKVTLYQKFGDNINLEE
mmetsp:Transcript_25977/g.72752  ORF Transcript_25977/g.72752 Transcript_25977/m.72752 type:complete len:123 (+) Transcript_25977:105-473(+)|eukprot:CAMPEP_0119131646 /NCGR_PEP_ID=MMETSP1310-20130426/10500_1 /TAXON_ID=464262 /ORGANISM="Genus nov. species nov., Strain RCC2339" /LENGTH=122 /DNA_ID=CAMNT_0007122233 /DNA_START=104 /DNA_END=472 /DNA_ORIENTATION=+